ncbi:MAG: large conductance mechanosensitive channel protein MscL [Clostridiales bacterium]|nr:large conductance mechanosensitive channel protein MscL [Clostridiales bacterium]
MFEEFKKFIARGNVIDLAVGVIIGAAFNKIVSSLVGDIITPIISFFTGLIVSEVGAGTGFNLSEFSISLGAAQVKIGAFATYVIDFLITGFSVFMLVKTINKLNDAAGKIAPFKKKKKKGKTEPSPPAEPEKKKCPFCISEIDAAAIKCPFCTADLITSDETVAETPADEKNEREESID